MWQFNVPLLIIVSFYFLYLWMKHSLILCWNKLFLLFEDSSCRYNCMRRFISQLCINLSQDPAVHAREKINVHSSIYILLFIFIYFFTWLPFGVLPDVRCIEMPAALHYVFSMIVWWAKTLSFYHTWWRD